MHSTGRQEDLSLDVCVFMPDGYSLPLFLLVSDFTDSNVINNQNLYSWGEGKSNRTTSLSLGLGQAYTSVCLGRQGKTIDSELTAFTRQGSNRNLIWGGGEQKTHLRHTTRLYSRRTLPPSRGGVMVCTYHTATPALEQLP